MARMTKDELERRLALAKGYGATPEQIEQKRKEYLQSGAVKVSNSPFVNLIADIGKSIVKPVTDYGRLVGEAGYQTLNLVNPRRIALSEKEKLGTLTADEAKELEKIVSPKFMRDKDVEAISGKPLSGAFYGAKKGVGAAATVAPLVAPYMAGGNFLSKAGTLKQAVGQGALLGGARGFGGDTVDVGQTLAETVAGGVAGGVASGAMYGAGKLGEMAKEKVRKGTPVELKGTALKDDVFFSENKKELDKVIREIGLDKKMTPTQKTEAIKRAWDNYEKQVADILEKNKNFTVDKNKILDDFTSYLNDRVDADKFDISTPGNKRFIDGLWEKVMKAKTPQELDSLKSELRKNINFSGTGSAKSEVHKGLWTAIKNSLDDIDPQVRAINNKENALFDIAKEVVGDVKGTANVGIKMPLVENANIDLPFNKGQLSAGVHKLFNLAPQAVSKVAPLADLPLAQQVGAGVVAGYAVGDTKNETPLQKLESDISRSSTQRPVTYLEAMQIAQTQGPEALDNMWVVHPEGKAIWNPIQKTWIAYNPQTSKLTESSQKIANAKASMDALLQDLESGTLQVSTGPARSRVQNIAGAVGMANKDYLEYKQRLETATIALRNAMLGSNMTAAEMKRFELPSPNEPLSTAIPKLRAVSTELGRWLQ